MGARGAHLAHDAAHEDALEREGARVAALRDRIHVALPVAARRVRQPRAEGRQPRQLRGSRHMQPRSALDQRQRHMHVDMGAPLQPSVLRN